MIKRIAALSILFIAVNAHAQTADDLFSPDTLHEVRLDLRPADWASLKEHYTEDIYFPCNFRWKFNGRDVDAPQIGCRNRGTGSRSPIKPGLRLQIDRYDKDRSFLGLKTIVLRNNSQDASMMHERVAMAFMRRMGIAAPRSTHTRLFVNGQYAGLYTIVEEVDEVFTRRVFGNSDGYLYKYDYGKDDPAHIFEYLGSDPARYSPKPFRPESHEEDPQANVIEAMIRTINQATDANFEQIVSEFVDFRAFMLEVGVEAYLAEQDGILGDYGLNNFYVYRLPTNNRFNFIPWDKSNTFFRIDRQAYQNTLVNILMSRALKVPNLASIFADTLLKAISSAGGPGGWLEQEVAKEYAQIRQAALDDPFKLCDPGASGTLRPCTNAEFEAEVAFMMRFARERGDIITRELSQTFNTVPGIQAFSVSDRGGVSMSTSGDASSSTVGYARILPNLGNRVPAGLAIFGYRSNNVLVTETAVPAVQGIRVGRVHAEVGGAVRTGLAIANPNTGAFDDAVINFFFTDQTGGNFGQGSFTVPRGRQMAAFLNEAPFNGGISINGTFTFTSNVPVGVVALRGLTNERSEFLLSTLPVVDLANPDVSAIIPHSAMGGGWSTQVVLVNPFEFAINGTITLQPSATNLPFTIAARSSTTVTPTSNSTDVQTAWIQVSANRPPAAFAVFSFRSNGVTVTSAGVQATSASSAFRMYVESAGSLQSGVAIVNSSANAVTVNFEVTTLTGQSTGLTGTLNLGAGINRSFFLNQIPGLQNLPSSFKGMLRISSSSNALTVVGLRGRYNERNDFLITTTPPISESAPPPTGELIVPELVDSGGYTTQIILYGAYAGINSAGLIQFFSQTGAPLGLRYQP